MNITLEGWDIKQFEEVDWVPWGSKDDARAKVSALEMGTSSH